LVSFTAARRASFAISRRAAPAEAIWPRPLREQVRACADDVAVGDDQRDFDQALERGRDGDQADAARDAVVAGLALAAVHPALDAALLAVLAAGFGAAPAAGLRALALAIRARLVAAGAGAADAGVVAGAALEIATGGAFATGLLAAARGAGGRLALEILVIGIDAEVSLEQVGDPFVLFGAELDRGRGLSAVAALAVTATRSLAVRLHARGGAISAFLRIRRVAGRLVRCLGVLIERDVSGFVREDDESRHRG
jgi:hypothetical protein